MFFDEFRQAKKVLLRVLPGAKKTEVVEKMTDGEWKLKLSAPARDGEANRELLRFLKKEGKISAVIALGKKDRKKLLTLDHENS